MEPKEVISFWFDECTPQDWFRKNSDFDKKLRERFREAHADATAGRTAPWRTTPEGRLAEIIVLDQFSRNMFRDTPASFASDTQALNLAQEAVRVGDDTKLEPRKRHFLYMPYMHSESKDVHEKALSLFASMTPWWQRILGLGQALNYERKHKAIIDRFGRYPHRNKILWRESTPEEVEFLESNPGF